MTKYRIRLPNGRVIGPFDKNQLFDLKAKGHIKGGEEAQIFPTGNWQAIESMDFYPELLDENKTQVASLSSKEETFVIDLTQLRNVQKEKEIEILEAEPSAPIEQLTETIRLSNSEAKISLSELEDDSVKESELAPETEAQGFEIDIPDEEDDSDNRTIINPVAQQEIERMRREDAEEKQKKLDEEVAAQKALEEAERLKKEKEAAALVPVDESTQMIKIDKLGLMAVAEENEQNIEDELKAYRKKKAKEEKALLDEYDESDDDEAKAKKKKLIIIAIAAAAIIYALMFPEEKPKKPPFRHLEPKIVFPIPFDVADVQKSKVSYNRGLEFFNKGTYPELVRAGLSFKESYENNLDNNGALNFMVRTYAEELQHSTNKSYDELTVFNIIQSKRPFLIQDPNGVIGLNLFYMEIGKTDAAIDAIQKYLKLKPKDVTQDLFATYLHSLIKKGKIDLARQFFQALNKAPQKSRYAFKSLIEYLVLNQERTKAMEYVDDAIKQQPQDVSFLLKKAEFLIEDGKLKEAVPYIKKANDKNLDNNNENYAKYLELKGMIYAFNKQAGKATAYFTRSLKLVDSNSLRMNLAKLEVTGGASTETDKLINESKAIGFLNQARDFYNKRNYELALSAAAKASDAYPGHIPSELFLAKVQLKLGLAEQGLKTLNTLVAKYPEDKTINLALIQAYIDTYKFNDARNRIQTIASSDYNNSPEYASVNAQLHLKMGDTLQAMSWLKNSITNNPLNDHDIYLLADILLRKGNYDAARGLLNKCMELDPVNPDYRIAYSQLIYETQDDMAAIGYLLSLQEDFGDNPKVMSEIAIFNYRAGKVKDFQDYKQKLEKNYATDSSLYEFLIKAALMDERNSDVPGLVEKLLAIEPGELEQMMTAGRVLFEEGKLVEAAKWFKRVEDKLPSYPKVLYYQARIDFMAGDLADAEKKIQRNMKENGENDTDLVLLAQIANSKEEFIAAENLYKKAQKLNPKSYDAIVGLADLSTKRNNHDLALDLYKRAMKLRSDEPIVHKKIGDVYRQLGQGALAIESYKMYLEMEPESPHKRNLEAYIQLMK